MNVNCGRLVLSGALLLGLPLSLGSLVYAATPVDLSHEGMPFLQTLSSGSISVQGVSQSIDFNQTLHLRIKEMYHGVPIWGGDGVVHIPHGPRNLSPEEVLLSLGSEAKINGTFYKNLDIDLKVAPSLIFGEGQAQKAIKAAINFYQQQVGARPEVKEEQSNLIVFVDDNNKAHWAYKVSFYADPAKDGGKPAKPNYIMDAISFQVYQKWDDIQTIVRDVTVAGGNGGNKKMGELFYDGTEDHLAALHMKLDTDAKTCALQNDDVTVRDINDHNVPTFPCKATDPDHANIYWDGEFHAVNDGFSPDNDALFGGEVIKNMYMKWYNVPVLIEDGKPMMLNMVVHARMDNAYWDGHQMTFGDGISMFYPLTSLGVAAHEISHGFTQQHSGLQYYGQSGGMNEAFSDMAAQGAEFYAYGKNSWQIGPEIFKKEGEALRYMDQPSKDCHGKEPGSWCSIDNVSQYHTGLDVHFSSGIYNRVFYLIGTSKGWDTRKAFDVMVKANSDYWTPSSSWAEGACGVLSAAKDYKYGLKAVRAAFLKVGIKTAKCDV